MCGLSRSVYNTRTEGQVKGLPYIESSKILCCECEAAVWVLRESSLQIRFCTHCKKFYPLNSFSKKGRKKSNVLLNTCSFCRDRFALTYAKTRKHRNSCATVTSSSQAAGSGVPTNNAEIYDEDMVSMNWGRNSLKQEESVSESREK
jgi:hypothetical protein